MAIRGRYLTEQTNEPAGSQVTGGIRLFYEGLEFNLKEERGKGLLLTGANGMFPVNPEIMLITENSALFTLPGGTILTFNSLDSSRGVELQISADFAADISEITIPVTPRRSSLVRDDGQVGILFSGSRYFLTSSGNDLEEGKLVLSKDNSFISYRARSKEKIFNPSDYMIAAAQNYETAVRNWQNTNFLYWNQNATPAALTLQNEDDIIAFLGESIQRGGFQTALNAFTETRRNNLRLSYKPSVYLGGMASAYPSFISSENEKLNHVTRIIRERSLEIFKEDHIFDYLLIRGNNTLAGELIEIINNIEPQNLIPDYIAGLFEIFDDFRQWRTLYQGTDLQTSSIEQLTNQMLSIIADNLIRDNENDAVYFSTSAAQDGRNPEYNIRLGKALVSWSQANQGLNDWNVIGRSLILSALNSANTRPGRLHNILNPVEYSPKAVRLTDTGHWAWTVSQSTTAAITNQNINLVFNFPVNMIHHVIIRGVRPFLRIQIHGQDWRSDSQFERYDSSGWVYYPQEQVLVLKLRHRSAVENVRIIYTPAPAPAPRPVVIQEPAAGDAVE